MKVPAPLARPRKTDEERKAAAREIKRRYQAKNKEKIAAARKEYREKNKATLREKKRAWKKKNPDKVRAAAAKERNSPSYQARRARTQSRYYYRTRGPSQIRQTAGEVLQTALNSNQLYAAAWSAVPTRFPRHTRDDIISMIVLAVLDGTFPAAEIPTQAQKFITAYYRESDYHRTISIDATIPGTDGLRLLDAIAAEPIADAEAYL